MTQASRKELEHLRATISQGNWVCENPDRLPREILVGDENIADVWESWGHQSEVTASANARAITLLPWLLDREIARQKVDDTVLKGLSTPITMTYRNYRGEVDQRTVLPSRIWFGSTEWHPEPGWLMSAYDLAKAAHRDFALADCQFADLCASGQQVRALEWGAEAKFSGQPAIYADSEFGVRMIVDHAVHGNGIQAYDETGVSIGVYPDFKAAKAAAQADYERRILAALTPAPQPEGTCDWCELRAADLRPRRDYEEGMTGRVYQVCGACRAARAAADAAELFRDDDIAW